MESGYIEGPLQFHGLSYHRVLEDDVVEAGMVRGREVALPPHFHDEDQITIVRSGQRRFVLGASILTLRPGGCAIIPAGAVHRSLPEPAGVDCFNLYVPASEYASKAMIREIESLRGAAWIEVADVMPIIRRYRLRLREDSPMDAAAPTQSVAERARRTGVSRENFSRAFSRRHGMPPRAFGLVIRLNLARGLLRSGAPIADAAYETGFADQSHLGRCFRRAFGVTPGRYRRGH